MTEQPIKMFLNWDDERHMFVMTYQEGDKLLFQVKMCPESFENMTSDMIRTVKNYNLYQLQLKEANEKQAEESRCSLPCTDDAPQPDQAEPCQPQND